MIKYLIKYIRFLTIDGFINFNFVYFVKLRGISVSFADVTPKSLKFFFCCFLFMLVKKCRHNRKYAQIKIAISYIVENSIENKEKIRLYKLSLHIDNYLTRKYNATKVRLLKKYR